MKFIDWMNLSLGIFASLIALSALIWNILSDRPKIKVKAFFNINSPSLDLNITAINVGKNPAHIHYVGFTTQDDVDLINWDQSENMPVELAPGNQHTFRIYVRNYVRNDAIVDYAFVRDGTDRYYRKKVDRYWEVK